MKDTCRDESNRFEDERTGVEITRLTESGENAHLYHYFDSFSPDDRWIVYNSSRNGRCQWWKMATDDFTSVRLSDSAPQSVGLSTTADWRFGYYCEGESYYRLDMHGGGADELWHNTFQAHHFWGTKISVDGSTLVGSYMEFLDEDHVELPGRFRSNLFILNADGSDPRVILDDTDGNLAHPQWALHDAELLTFCSEVKGLDWGRRMQPELVRADGSEHRELFPRNPWNHERAPLVDGRNPNFGSHNVWDRGPGQGRLVCQQWFTVPYEGMSPQTSPGGSPGHPWKSCAVGYVSTIGADGSDWRVEAFYPYARTGHTGVDHQGRYLAFDPEENEILRTPYQQIVVADRRTRSNHLLAVIPKPFTRLQKGRGKESYIGGEHTHLRPTFSRGGRYVVFSSDYGRGKADVYLIDLSQFDWWQMDHR